MQLIHREEAGHIPEDARPELIRKLAFALEAKGFGDEFVIEFDEQGGLCVVLNEMKSPELPEVAVIEQVVQSVLRGR